MRKTSTYIIYLLLKVFVIALFSSLFASCDDGDKKSTQSPTMEASASDSGSSSDASTADSNADASSSDNSSSSAAKSSSDGSRKILAFGDSITLGVGTSDPYPSKLERLTGDQVINAGIRSQTSSQGLRRIGGILSQHNPTHVCILYGTNDVRTGISAGATASNIGAMVNAVRASGAKAIVGTLPPLFEQGGSLKNAVDAANGRIRGTSGATIADIARQFGNGAGNINSDGIHPNNSGAAIIAVTFSDKL